MTLADKLGSFAHNLDEAERQNYKYLLGMAAGGLARNGAIPHAGREAQAFRATLHALSHLQPHHRQIPENGIAYRGRPGFITAKLFAALRAESQDYRASAVRFDDHFVASNAPVARGVAFSTELNDLLRDSACWVAPTAKANYLYYDDVGLGIDPHIDGEDFSVNAILMLKHDYRSEPSALVVYPTKTAPQRILLEPGEMVVLYADSTTHARERMKRDENVSIVAFGFHPIY